MTDEEKKVEAVVEQEEKECGCCECRTILSDFLLRLGAVFLGTLLAILVAASVLKPQMPGCPCHKSMMGFGSGVESMQNHPCHKFDKEKMHKQHFENKDFNKNKVKKDRPVKKHIED